MLREWFRQLWPTHARAVVQDYVTIGLSHRYFLADLCLRGNVYRAQHPLPRDPFEAGVFEGRRQLALEVVKLAKADPNYLFSLLEEKPKPERGDRK